MFTVLPPGRVWCSGNMRMTKWWLSLGEVTGDQEGAGGKGKEETHLVGTKLGGPHT